MQNICPSFCYRCEECGATRCILRPTGHANWPLPCKQCGGEMERAFDLEQGGSMTAEDF